MRRKYAMIPIIMKLDESGDTLVRKVLISYRYKRHKKLHKQLNDPKIAFYHKTKIITVDDYFTNKKSSHQYRFFDRSYCLIEVIKENPNHLFYTLKSDIYNPKKYHGFDKPYLGYPTVIEFKAKSEEEAIHKFLSRGELQYE